MDISGSKLERLARLIRRPPWRTVFPLLGVLIAIALGYLLWSPGKQIRDGRHDLRTNGIWLQARLVGATMIGFARYQRDKSQFRSDEKVRELADLLSSHGIKFVLSAPLSLRARAAQSPVSTRFKPSDSWMALRSLKFFPGLEESTMRIVFPNYRRGALDSPNPRASCFGGILDLPGVHLNIEPMPSGNVHFLTLLEELKAAIPSGKNPVSCGRILRRPAGIRFPMSIGTKTI